MMCGIRHSSPPVYSQDVQMQTFNTPYTSRLPRHRISSFQGYHKANIAIARAPTSKDRPSATLTTTAAAADLLVDDAFAEEV